MTSKFKPKEVDWMKQADTSDTSLEAADAALYGSVGVRESGRVVIKPVDIMDIWPDLAQPRRAIPLAVRGQWHGNPLHVIEVLDTWQRMAESAGGSSLDIVDILQGRGEGFDTPENPIAEAFIDLLRLAASIFADGLTNAITIAPGKDKFLIETGERRWLAHHLLYHHIDEKFGKILAREVQRDVWRQATENNQRRKLNAIEMARQLALLVMDMYEGDRNTSFDSLEMMMRDGCDRYFYAQVAQGRLWKVKDGFAERVQAAMGLTSYRMVAAYRNLLRLTDDDKLNDEIWIRADMENWSEFRIRTHLEVRFPQDGSLPTGKHGNEETPSTGNKTDRSLPTGKHDTPATTEFAIGQRVIIDGNGDIKGVVASRKSMGGYTINLMKGGSRWFASSRLTPVAAFSNSSVQPRGAVTPTIKEESDALDNESDYENPDDDFEDEDEWDDDPVDDTPDFSPFDQDNVEILNYVSYAADMLDNEQAFMIDDLAVLDRKRLQQWVADGGIEEIKRMAQGYREAKASVLKALDERIDIHIDSVVALALKMVEES